MASDSLSQRKAQLDKEEREHLEDVVTEMRERVEDNVEFQLTQKGLDDEPEDVDSLDEDTQQLVEAIELEAPDDESWSEAFEQYITGVGYTIVNRLAALRCMEVRDFIDEEVTIFKDNGLTPAAETLVHEEFLLEDEAILEAYHNACDDLAAEIEILFDRSSAYSLIDPDDDTFEELCGMLDSVEEEVWRADDVLGWVYEYYNHANLDGIRKRAHSGGGLRTNDIAAANQFYTPHWVVRMLTDNALGKLYLEHTGELQDVVEAQKSLTSSQRKNRELSVDDSGSLAEFCTYLVPSEKTGEPTSFSHPSELRIIDPACGSGHFLLYAFDILERIWRAETKLDPAEIPTKILKHNLYGIDLDLRACQLAAFSLYLKGRSRAEAEGADTFGMPDVGIVCADANIADMDAVDEVFTEVADGQEEVEKTLAKVLDAFEEVQGLGSLLDVRGTLGELFESDGSRQLTFAQNFQNDHSLSSILHSLQEAISEHTDDESLLAQDLRSFIRLLDVLAQDYDVALMNPPYGSGKRMPNEIQEYVENHYRYYREFYINFFEVCETLAKPNGRIGMLVPWTLMFKRSFQEFREDFIGSQGAFDFLAEYGYGVLDNATVGTVGTVVRKSDSSSNIGEFIRLHDVDKGRKEHVFSEAISGEYDGVKRYYAVELEEFADIPGTPIMYSIPGAVRELHDTEQKIDPERADIKGEGIADAVQGLATGNNDRFVRMHWEVTGDEFKPYAKGGTEAWVLPQQITAVNWSEDGKELKRAPGSVIRNEDFYMREGLTWSYIKRTGRRFGYVPGSVFDVTGSMLFPDEERSPWLLLSVLNSTIYHGLFLSITPERDWQIEVVGRIPWHEELDDVDELESIAKEQYATFASQKSSDPRHPFYVAAALVPTAEDEAFYDSANHRARRNVETTRPAIEPDMSISEAAKEVERWDRQTRQQIERLSNQADALIADALNLPEGINDELRTEIFLRTSENEGDRNIPAPEDVPERPDALESNVKDLVHHFAMKAVRESDDGIIPVESTTNQPDILDRLISQFETVYGSHATDRLVEVDSVLGEERAEEEAYPNLRRFVEEDLFEYHVDTMERTPIIWKLTTKRLVTDADKEGFACFVDYHQLSNGLFDRMMTQYLEPAKAELRERRSAADRRRSDDSLPARERATASERYDRVVSAHEQISLFEDTLQELAETSSSEIDDDDRDVAARLAETVAEFRAETKDRLETLDELRELRSQEWFEDTFSPSFWEQVEANRGEWIDALDDLETACETYSRPTNEPVDAHLADLFEYIDDVLGSDHYSSTGILFMTYYFEREGEPFLDEDDTIKSTLQDEAAQRLATLAEGLDEYKSRAMRIEDGCDSLGRALPSNWEERALTEITVDGYHPNPDYGIEINITPLADAEIVPKTVNDDVL
jgi:hypothetical protein